MTLNLLAACAQPPKPPSVAEHGVPQVGIWVVKPELIPVTSELYGQTAPAHVIPIWPQVAGKVQLRKFREDSNVKAGELLYQMESTPQRVGVESAIALLSKAEAGLASAMRRVRWSNEMVASGAAADPSAESDLTDAKAKLASATAALRTARANLAATRITSPIAGRIGKSSVEPGAWIAANQTEALAVVQKIDPIFVDLLEPSVAQLLEKGVLSQESLDQGWIGVRLLLDDGTAFPAEGRLRFPVVKAREAIGEATARAEFPNPKSELLPGMKVRLRIQAVQTKQALLVPLSAVHRDAAGNSLAYVVNDEGKLELRKLTAERVIGNQLLVASGLKAGDRLVIDGGQSIKPGTAVQVRLQA